MPAGTLDRCPQAFHRLGPVAQPLAANMSEPQASIHGLASRLLRSCARFANRSRVPGSAQVLEVWLAAQLQVTQCERARGERSLYARSCKLDPHCCFPDRPALPATTRRSGAEFPERAASFELAASFASLLRNTCLLAARKRFVFVCFVFVCCVLLLWSCSCGHQLAYR